MFVNSRLNNGLEFVVIEHEIYDGTIPDDLFDVYIRDKGNYCYTFGMDPLGHINKTLEEIAEELNYEKNRGKTPQMYTKSSNQKVWWKCDLGHEWRTAIVTRTSLGLGCPECAKNRRKY